MCVSSCELLKTSSSKSRTRLSIHTHIFQVHCIVIQKSCISFGEGVSNTHVSVHAKSLQSCSTFWDPVDCSLSGSSVHGILLCPWHGVGCYAFLQGIFLTQGSNPHLLRLLHTVLFFLDCDHVGPLHKQILWSLVQKYKEGMGIVHAHRIDGVSHLSIESRALPGGASENKVDGGLTWWSSG